MGYSDQAILKFKYITRQTQSFTIEKPNCSHSYLFCPRVLILRLFLPSFWVSYLCTFDLVIANSWFVQFHLLFLLFCLTAFRCMPNHCILLCSQSSTAKSKFNWSYYLTWYCFIATPLCRFSIRGTDYLWPVSRRWVPFSMFGNCPRVLNDSFGEEVIIWPWYWLS